jgi:hypothetical protein
MPLAMKKAATANCGRAAHVNRRSSNALRHGA